MSGDPKSTSSPQPESSLHGVRAAQLRVRAFRWGLGKLGLGTLFLVGALAHGLGPAPHAGSATFWMAALAILSTFNVGLGLRTLARARQRGLRLWPVLTAAWALLVTTLLKLVLMMR
jgi:hypothetical protein